MDTAEFIDRVRSLRGMNKEESKIEVGINYGKSFLKVSPKTMVDYYNDFKMHQSSPSGSAFKFSGAKRMPLQAPQTHLNRQEIVYLAKVNDILDYIFIGGLEMPNLMTGFSSYASTHPEILEEFFYLLQARLNEASYDNFSVLVLRKVRGNS